MAITREVLQEPMSAAARAEAVERSFGRNVFGGLVFEGSWAVGMAFATSSVLIPTYLVTLGAPRWLIGLASAIPVFCSPLQLFSERLAGGRNRRRNIWLLYTLCALSYVAIAAMSWWIESAGIRIAIFITLMFGFFACHALCFTMYQAIMTDNCPVRRRGMLFGFRMGALGLGGLAVLPLSAHILSHWDGPHKYLMSLLIAGSIFVLASLSPLLLRDHIDPARGHDGRSRKPHLILLDALRLVKRLWHTPNYRVFMFFAIALNGGTSLSAFIVTYARDVLGREASPQTFQYCVMGALIASGLFVAAVADRWGYQITLVLSAAVALTAFMVAQFAQSLTTALVAYGLMNVALASIPAVVANFSVELAPDVPPAQLIASASVLCLPVNLAIPFLCGLVLDLSRARGATEWGYHVIFTLAAAMILMAGLGAWLLVQEPRTGKVYEIKVIQRG